ncbi:MAG: hypothetical protein KTR16_12255 [Acidiferrobacterales bacterium]|nr:hypothetical protein [Acidiferrobacterales bacterium]
MNTGVQQIIRSIPVQNGFEEDKLSLNDTSKMPKSRFIGVRRLMRKHSHLNASRNPALIDESSSSNSIKPKLMYRVRREISNKDVDRTFRKIARFCTSSECTFIEPRLMKRFMSARKLEIYAESFDVLTVLDAGDAELFREWFAHPWQAFKNRNKDLRSSRY